MDSILYHTILIIKLQAILCFVSLPCSSIAQEYLYFNNRLDLNGLNEIDRSYNIVMNNNGYVIAGSSIVYGETIYWWEKVLAKINFEGQITFIKHYEEDSVEYFFPYTPDYLIDVESNYFAVGIRREPVTGWFHQEATLMCLDENLDTIWMKRFGEKIEPFDTAYYFASMQKNKNKELIMTGAWKPQGSATNVYLLKSDSLGNMIWDNSFSFYNFFIEGQSVSQTSDSGFIIGCFKQTPGYPYTIDPVLIKTDSLGNQEWTKNLGGPYKDFTPMVSICNDGNIIIGTSIGDSMFNSDVSYTRINFVKLNNQGSILWNKKYGSSRPNNLLRKIRVLDDGSIIAVGATTKYNPEPDRVGWILKTDPEGDSLWYREYAHLTGYESRNYLYDVIATNDNGLIACGYIDPYLPDTGSTDTWVIKLDSIGCEWAWCDTTVGIEEDDKTVRLYDCKKGGLEVWPNPGSGIVNCQLSIVNCRGDLQLMIYDVFGREVDEIKVPDGQNTIKINVESYPPGVYIVILKKGFDLLESSKFVIAR